VKTWVTERRYATVEWNALGDYDKETGRRAVLGRQQATIELSIDVRALVETVGLKAAKSASRRSVLGKGAIVAKRRGKVRAI
jgi:hypothetical protein